MRYHSVPTNSSVDDSALINSMYDMHQKYQMETEDVDFNREVILQYQRFGNRKQAIEHCIKLGCTDKHIEDHLNNYISTNKKTGRLQGVLHIICGTFIAGPLLIVILNGGIVLGFLGLFCLIGCAMFVLGFIQILTGTQFSFTFFWDVFFDRRE